MYLNIDLISYFWLVCFAYFYPSFFLLKNMYGRNVKYGLSFDRLMCIYLQT